MFRQAANVSQALALLEIMRPAIGGGPKVNCTVVQQEARRRRRRSSRGRIRRSRSRRGRSR